MNRWFIFPKFNREFVGHKIYSVLWTDEFGRKLITTYDQDAKGLAFYTALASTV